MTEPKPLPGPAPVCPVCNTEMDVVRHAGRDGSSIYWDCDCTHELLSPYIVDTWKGDYA